MRRFVILVIVFVLLIAAGLYAKRKYYDPKQRLESAAKQVAKLAENREIREGDLIFQTSLSGQSRAIQLATHSQYSHCGIIHLKGTDYFVYEAVEPVKWTHWTSGFPGNTKDIMLFGGSKMRIRSWQALFQTNFHQLWA